MRWILAMAVWAAPGAVWAAYEHGAAGCAHGHGGGALGAALMAGAAALGYWVLRQSEKDAGMVRWAGRVAGWVLLVVGLLGFLCGAFHHLKCGGEKKACDHGGSEYGRSSGMMQMPPGHPPIEGLGKKRPESGRSGRKAP